MNITIMLFVWFISYGVAVVSTFGILYWLVVKVLGAPLRLVYRQFFFNYKYGKLKNRV